MVTSEAQLLRRHLPILRYDSQGSYPADSPGVLTDRPGNELRRADGTVLARGGEGILGFLGWPAYADGTAAQRSDLLDATGRDYVSQAREMHRAPYADHIHGRAVRDEAGGGWWLQYWFFYLYNDKAFLGLGLHEGDWEMVQLRLDRDERPVAMAFAAHNHGGRCGWNDVEQRGARPVVYVARGSQASFPRSGRHDAPVVPDYADGRGREVAAAALDVVGDGAPAWVAWPGRWGSTKARSRLESPSPRGPRHQEKWSEPLTFFEECDDLRRRRAGPPPPGPPAPVIEVRRDHDRAIVSYTFTTAADKPAPAVLVVSVDKPSDDLPPATYTMPVEAMHGELEHPLALEEGPYELRVSAASEAGDFSPVVTAALE